MHVPFAAQAPLAHGRHGMSETALCRAYNLFDVLFVTTLGEGFHLPSFEAMASLGRLTREGGDGTPATAEEAREEEEALRRCGSLLERHKEAQQKLWPSISSPTVAALWAALAPIAHGSFICGAGNGGHVLAILKRGTTKAAVERAVLDCAAAPEAKVVLATLVLRHREEDTSRDRRVRPRVVL